MMASTEPMVNMTRNTDGCVSGEQRLQKRLQVMEYLERLAVPICN